MTQVQNNVIRKIMSILSPDIEGGSTRNSEKILTDFSQEVMAAAGKVKI